MACCNEHSRSEILRRGLAEAGRGLPDIEAGMPLPAGTGLDRRTFLSRGVGLALAVYGGAALGPRVFDEGIASAAAASSKQKVLVSIFLDGGADSLSLLAPTGDPLYRQLRPRLAIAAGSGPTFSEDPGLTWHPSLAPLAQLHGEGKVNVMPGIGYDHPNQSHFTSRHFWEVGAADERLSTGWLGRYIDRVGKPDNPLQGLSLDWSLQPSLATAKMPVAAVDAPDRYDFYARGVWGEISERMVDAIGRLGSLPTRGDPALAASSDAARQSAQLYRQLTPFRPKDDRKAITSPVAYPSGDDRFPRRLAGLAAMLSAGLPLRVVALSAPGGYDTHDNQAQDLADDLKLTADSLLAFQRDLEARGLADRVLVHVWTEFGRRAKENGSGGTDHGAAGTGFLIGSQVAGRMIGEFPGLGKLDEQGNLRATADFRGLYGAILEDWLGTDAEAIIPGAKRYLRPKILR
jgi:uncharacterized protein (DUF1501 family)